MAGEHGGDALFYDFLIDEPEIPTPTPRTTTNAAVTAALQTNARTVHANAINAPHSSPHFEVDFATNIATDRPHLAHLQQPISVSNRTSPQPQRHLPNSPGPRHHSHHGLLTPSATVAGPSGSAGVAPPAPLLPPLAPAHQGHQSHQGHQGHHGGHLEMDIHQQHLDQSRAQSRYLHHPGVLDLHGAHHAQSLAPMPAVSFALSAPPVTAAPDVAMPVDWGVYGVAHPAMPIHPSPFEFDLHGGAMMPAMSPHGHISPTISDPSLTYGGAVVSPSSIHSAQSHYGFSSSWEDHLGHEASTPTVTTPAGQFSTNPWTDPEEIQQEVDRAQNSRPKKTTRPRRTKRDARRNSNSDSRPGRSPDAASPSSSQTSRASIGSKAASMASSSVATSSIASSSTTSSRPSKLRSASRTSKNSHNKPNDTPEDRRTRASHNLVEKQYRNRLNSQFESLLSALPEQIRSGGEGGDSDGGGGAADWGDRRVSKGEVLEMARKHIKTLERERDMLERENNELHGSIAHYKRSGDDDRSGNDTPLDFNADDDKESDQS